MKLTPNILANFEFADIVRGSNEDFKVLYNIDSADKIYKSEISFYCKNFIYTNSNNPIVLHADNGFRKEYPLKPLETVSTIGAGDNFNAGIVYGIISYGITKEDIENGPDEKTWDKLIACAEMFSADCCKSIDNSVSWDFGKNNKIKTTI